MTIRMAYWQKRNLLSQFYFCNHSSFEFERIHSNSLHLLNSLHFFSCFYGSCSDYLLIWLTRTCIINKFNFVSIFDIIFLFHLKLTEKSTFFCNSLSRFVKNFTLHIKFLLLSFAIFQFFLTLSLFLFQLSNEINSLCQIKEKLWTNSWVFWRYIYYTFEIW